MAALASQTARSRLLVLIAILLSITLGLVSRSTLIRNAYLESHAGDALWAMMVYFGFAFLLPRTSIFALLILAASFCLGIELSQRCNHPLLADLRDTRVGALVLGRGFLWIDLLRYSAGIFIALLLDLSILCKPATERNSDC